MTQPQRDDAPSHAIAPLSIRWMIRADLPAVLEIERAAFGDNAWSEGDFRRELSQYNCIRRVAEFDERVVGYVVYELHRNFLHITNLAVHPEFRRRRVAAAIMAIMRGHLSLQRRTRIACLIRDKNHEAQAFFRQQGFRATGLLRGYHPGSEDAWEFCYTLPMSAENSGGCGSDGKE